MLPVLNCYQLRLLACCFPLSQMAPASVAFRIYVPQTIYMQYVYVNIVVACLFVYLGICSYLFKYTHRNMGH